MGDLAKWLQDQAAQRHRIEHTFGNGPTGGAPGRSQRSSSYVDHLVPKGGELLESLTAVHRQELQQLEEPVRQLLAMLDASQ